MRVSLVAGVFLLANACYARETVPSDFAFSIAFFSENIGAGPGDLASWQTLIDSRGRAVQELHYLGGTRTVRKHAVFFSSKEMQNLVAVLKTRRFFTLPENLSNCFDCGALVLKLTMDGRTHSIRLSGADMIKDKSLVRRVRDIWALVVRKVPSPLNDDELHNLQINS